MALDRRDFIKFAIGGAIGSMFTPIPWKLADDISIWTQNWPWIPRIPKGELQKKPSVIKLGNSPYGVYVNFVGNRPCTISGNGKHPLSLGGIDPIGASGCALMYSPSRIKNPKIKEKDGKFKDISIEKAKEILITKLKEASKNTDSILFVSGDHTSSSNEVFSAILSNLGSKLFFLEPSDRQKYFKAWYEFLNGNGEVGFDIENSDLILVAGCNFLDSWGTHVRNQRAFGKGNTKIYFVGPYKNNTSIVAERSLLISEGNIYKFLFAVAAYLAKISSRIPRIYGIEEFISFVSSNYEPSKVAEEIGCRVSDIEEFAVALKNAKRPLVIAGSSISGTGPIQNILAGLILNVFLDRINQKGGIRCIPKPPSVISSSMDHNEILKNDLMDLIYSKGSQKIKTAIFYETNPFYFLPKDIRSHLAIIPFKVCFSPFMNETALACDLVIPSPYFLERLDDCFTPFGSGSANYCVSDKLVETDIKNPPDLFIEIAGSLGIKLEKSSFYDVVKTKSEYLGIKIDKLKAGDIWTDDTNEIQYGLKIWDDKLQELFSQEIDNNNKGLELIPINVIKVGSNLVGLYPFALDVIYEDEIANHDLFARIHPDTGEKYHLNEKDFVTIKTKSGEIQAKIKIDPGVIPGAVAILSGLGRSIEDQFNKNIGENISDLFEVKKDDKTGSFYWSPNRVSVSKI